MKLMITCQKPSESAGVDERFGRCAYFAVYNSEEKTFEYFENKGLNEVHGAGIAAAEFVIKQEVDALATGRLGPKAQAGLSGASLQVYKLSGETVREVATAWENGQLCTL